MIELPKVRVATGLYSHLDSVIKADKKIMDWIRDSKSEKPRGDLLESMENVSFSLKRSIKNGDMESFISKEVYDELDSLFHKREIRTGGNGNNMGQTLFELGLVPLVSYPVRSRKLMVISKKFKVACGSKFKTPMEAIREVDPDYDHIIFEADKWRNILCWDLITSRGVFDEDFLCRAFSPKSTDVAIISYAHLLLPKFSRRTDYLLEFIKRDRPKVHLEFGLGSERSMRHAMEALSESAACDSWGMDENECKLYLGSGPAKEDMIEAAVLAMKEYNLGRICVHGAKFAFSVSKQEPRKEAEALAAGCTVAVEKASGKEVGRIASSIRKIGSYNLCLVNVPYEHHPKQVTGLGDSFAAVSALKSLS